MDGNDLIAKVATRHKVMLEPGDSIFLIGTIFEEHMKEAVAAIGSVVEAGALQMAATADEQSTAARATAEALITQSGEWACCQIRTTMDQAAGEFAAQFEAQVVRIQKIESRAVTAALLACFAALVSVGFLAVYLLV